MTVAERLREDYCAPVRGFITPEYAETLADMLSLPKQESIKYLSMYKSFDVPVPPICFIKLLVDKSADVSRLIGEDVLPTYTYGRVYGNKSVLPRHVDRPACDISVTVNLKQDAQWLIGAENADSKITLLDLQAGDAMLYYGCDAWHWREGEFTGTNYTQLFMHYVRMNSPRAEHYFDRLDK
jgi:hypothetical protein